MVWFNTVDHHGQEVGIASIDDMNAVVDAYEARLDQLALLLKSSDREARCRAAAEYGDMAKRRERIETDVRKATGHAEIASEDRYHCELAEAIRTRTKG